ncbi:MAG: DUF368 domain-containing protein [Candidatus Acidoferrales bacterium]
MSEPMKNSGPLPAKSTLIRGIAGGVLMGLANLVPGISGGTMLLAAGIYPAFIEGIAEVTTLRFRVATLVFLAIVAGSALAAIVTLAGVVQGLVIDHRWAMYSLFIGLTLGGVPVVWRLLRPLTRSAIAGTGGGLLLMGAMAVMQPGASGAGEASSVVLMLAAGIAGASAMILPGISGSYIWLVMGVYLTILGSIEQCKIAVLSVAGGGDVSLLLGPMAILAPLAMGVGGGVAGISNLMRHLLARFEKATLGFLLGLLLGAVLGLWPFRQGVPPRPG